jgi:hypothetical protein
MRSPAGRTPIWLAVAHRKLLWGESGLIEGYHHPQHTTIVPQRATNKEGWKANPILLDCVRLIVPHHGLVKDQRPVPGGCG